MLRQRRGEQPNQAGGSRQPPGDGDAVGDDVEENKPADGHVHEAVQGSQSAACDSRQMVDRWPDGQGYQTEDQGGIGLSVHPVHVLRVLLTW